MGNSGIFEYIKKYKFKSMFLRTLITVLLIIIIPFSLISFMVYSGSSAALKNETVTLTNEKTENVVAATNNFIRSMDRLSIVIQNLSEVQKCCVTDEYKINLSEDYSNLMERLSMYTLTYGYIQSVGVYSKLNNCLINEKTNMKFYDANSKLIDWYYQSDNKLEMFTDGNDDASRNIITFMRPIMMGNESMGFVAINVYVDKLFETIGINASDDVDVMMLVDENDKIILSSQQNIIGKVLYEVVGAGANKVSINGKRYVVSYANAYRDDLQYVYMYDTAYYNMANKSMIYLSVIMILCVVFVCILLALYISIRTFRPLIEIIEQFDDDMNGEDINEIGYIARNILRVSNEKTLLSKEMQKKMVMLNKAQISVLQNQISPHFTHNTLETIKWLVVELEDEDTSASFMIEMLSKIFKYSLDMSNYLVSLETEIENTKNYISILKIRYPDKFDVIWDVDDEARGAQIIKLSLQPIVENAISHGINLTRRKGIIRIKIDVADGDLRVVISDNGVGINPQTLENIQKSLDGEEIFKGKGIGLSNVNLRIKLIFGEEYGLKITSAEGEGTTITMLMKLQ